MKILIVTSGDPFVRGDAETAADGLRKALVEAGHQAELIVIPFRDYPARSIPDQMLACRLLDLTESCGARIDRMIGLKFPAYLIPHPNKVIWLLHQHRAAYELWGHPVSGSLIDCADGVVVRDAIRQADCELIPEAGTLYTQSQNVSSRLQRGSGITADVLYHPPADADCFHKGSAGDYLLFPSPVRRANRQRLALQALAQCRERVVIRFAGESADPAEQTECANAIRKFKLGDRVQWLGTVPDDQKRELYAQCLGVVYPPVDEDYGYVTLEAMLSAKAVITCSDAGGPVEFVADRRTGFVTDPTPQSLAQAMDMLWADRRCAGTLGDAGRDQYQDLRISWPNVVEKLTC